MSEATPENLQIASLSDVGRQRKTNQDSCGEARNDAGERLLVVCDGLGGHNGGERASRIAVDSILEVFEAGEGTPEALLKSALATAHERVVRQGNEEPELRGMATTAVVLLLGTQGDAWVAHVGDSRAYRLRGGRIEQLTADHSEVAELVRSGRISEEEAAALPRNRLLQAIGVESGIEPDVAHFAVQPGDRFLLCSDGLWNVVGDEEIRALLGGRAPADAARELVALANDRGAPDNVTVQIAAPPTPETSADAEAFGGVDVDAAWGRMRTRVASRLTRRIRRTITAVIIVIVLLIGAIALLRGESLDALAGAAARVLPVSGGPPAARHRPSSP